VTNLFYPKDRLQGWYVSMLLVSLGVHAVVLVLPLPQQSQQQSQPLQPEPKTVKITSLVAPQQSSTATRPVPPRKPVAQPVQSSVQPKQKQVAQTKTTERVQLPIQAIATPLSTPSPTRPATPTPSPNSNQVPAKQETTPTLQTAAPGSVTQLFGDLASRDRRSESSDISVTPNLFTNPDLFFELASLPAQPQLKPEILRATWIAAKTPTQVYVEILVVQGQSNNFQVSERGIYSEGTVYEVKQGENTWYFNLVPTRQEGTAIVVWKRDPSTLL